MNQKLLKLFLRFGLSIAFLSACADRFGFLNGMVSPDSIVWGNWANFQDYTAILNPWTPISMIPLLAFVATFLEVLFGVCLLIGLSTEFFAKLSGILLLIFALSMGLTVGFKSSFDYSVFAASGAAFALGTMKNKYLELDCLFIKKKS